MSLLETDMTGLGLTTDVVSLLAVVEEGVVLEGADVLEIVE